MQSKFNLEVVTVPIFTFFILLFTNLGYASDLDNEFHRTVYESEALYSSSQNFSKASHSRYYGNRYYANKYNSKYNNRSNRNYYRGNRYYRGSNSHYRGNRYYRGGRSFHRSNRYYGNRYNYRNYGY